MICTNVLPCKTWRYIIYNIYIYIYVLCEVGICVIFGMDLLKLKAGIPKLSADAKIEQIPQM